MKSLFRSLALLLGVGLVASCANGDATRNISGPTAGAALKFFNFGVGDPAVNFYADTLKLSAILTSSCSSAIDGTTSDTTCINGGKESTAGTAYGAAGIGTGLYASIAPGSYTLSGRITATTDNGLKISATPASLENGKFYSYYLSGIYNTTTKTVEGFVVEDPLPATIDYTRSTVRFVNAISNSQPMTLYAKDQTSGVEVPIGSTVAYKQAGAFVPMVSSIYDLSTRVAGSSTNVITRTGVSFNTGRVYTITAYGDITATTAPKKPALDNTANR